MDTAKITFIGGGNMAASLIAGLVADGYAPDRLQVFDPDASRCLQLRERFGVSAVSDDIGALALAPTVVLCVKPQIAARVCRSLAEQVATSRPLIISIMAGVTEAAIQRWLGAAAPVVRVMPNTPAMLQTGASGMHASAQVDAAGRNRAETILRAVGLVRWVADEAKIDAVTAISGSGPAYFFLFMEALEAAAVELGLDAESARLLTIQTALGAARMAMENSAAPAELRAQVTSPGGTTERALEVFNGADLSGLVARAAAAARQRAEELSRTLTEQS